VVYESRETAGGAVITEGDLTAFFMGSRKAIACFGGMAERLPFRK